MSMKNSSDTIGNRTRDLPAYSAVKFCMVARIIFNTIASVFCSFCSSESVRITVMVKGHPRVVGPQYGRSRHSSNTQNLEVADRFLENLYTSDACHAL
jgi:hypothetical protein